MRPGRVLWKGLGEKEKGRNVIKYNLKSQTAKGEINGFENSFQKCYKSISPHYLPPQQFDANLV